MNVEDFMVKSELNLNIFIVHDKTLLGEDVLYKIIKLLNQHISRYGELI